MLYPDAQSQLFIPLVTLEMEPVISFNYRIFFSSMVPETRSLEHPLCRHT